MQYAAHVRKRVLQGALSVSNAPSSVLFTTFSFASSDEATMPDLVTTFVAR